MGVLLRVFGLIVVAGVASAGVGRGRNSHRVGCLLELITILYVCFIGT